MLQYPLKEVRNTDIVTEMLEPGKPMLKTSACETEQHPHRQAIAGAQSSQLPIHCALDFSTRGGNSVRKGVVDR